MAFESDTGIATPLTSMQIRVIEVTCVRVRKLCRCVKGEDGYLSCIMVNKFYHLYLMGTSPCISFCVTVVFICMVAILCKPIY
jgi:hypothetical protein